MTTWMTLEDMVLNEISPTQKDRYKLMEAEGTMRGPEAEKNGELSVKGHKVSVIQDD